MPLRSEYDAVVVGGGHNGLTAAAYLAKSGQSVLLLERDSKFGGASVSDRIFPGVDANLSRYAYLVSLFPTKIIKDLGLRFTSRSRSVASCTPYQRNGTRKALLLFYSDPARSEESFRAVAGAEDWRGYQRFMDLQRVLASEVWPTLLAPLRTRAQWESGLKTSDERQAWTNFVDQPLGEAIERHISNDVIRGLLFTDAKIGVFTRAHDPSLLQNRCFLLHVVGKGTGEWQVPIGGVGALSNELARVASAGGAALLNDSHVTGIEVGKTRHTVSFVRQDQASSVTARRVLVNVGPQVFTRLLGKQQSKPAAEGSVCKVNLVLERLPKLKAEGVPSNEAFAGTFHVNEGFTDMERSFQEAATGRLPQKPPFEAYCHTLTDDSILGSDLRARGYHTVTMFGLDVPYQVFTENNDRLREKILRRYLRSLNSVLQEPVEECLAKDRDGSPCIEVKTPVDLERELLLPRGHIFHGSPSWFFTDDPDQEGKWGVETAYPGIYNCGASATRGGGVSGIPGHNAARAIFAESSRSVVAAE